MREYPSVPHSVLVSKHIYREAIDHLAGRVAVDYNDSDESLSGEQLRARLGGKHGVICQLTDHIDASLLDAAPSVRVVSNIAVGFDNKDVAAATERGVIVTNTPGVLTDTTADLAFALILGAGRRIGESERYLRAGRYRQWRIDLLTGWDVWGATLGIFGMGRIGQAVARRGRGFNMRVLYHDPFRLSEDAERALGIEFAPKGAVLKQADFVSLHCALTPETRHLIGAAELRAMKPTSVLVNTSRGPVVDEAALADALQAGTIAAAGLDVFEREPEVHPKLLQCENALMVPHIASASAATRTRMCVMAAENMLAGLAGERPPDIVNPEVLD
ncbi:MAG: D-glycerate dehydrogenase [Acidobacteriia bacterium]|nr:D-glycerate dehydrogenase [Terriglobia bacterium]